LFVFRGEIILKQTQVDKKGLLETEAKQSRENANQVMENIMSGAGVEKKMSVILEFVIGKVQETIQTMVIYIKIEREKKPPSLHYLYIL
jgi:hypothetical protein